MGSFPEKYNDLITGIYCVNYARGKRTFFKVREKVKES